MQVDPISGDWLDFSQVAARLGISLATFKKRLRTLELYRVLCGFDATMPGRVSENVRKQVAERGWTALKELEAELDRSFAKWRQFPGKEKLGRRFFWGKVGIDGYANRVAGVTPLP